MSNCKTTCQPVSCTSVTVTNLEVETPITVIDTDSVDLTVSGAHDHTLQADVNVSGAPGNSLQILGDGLFVPEAEIDCPDARACLSNGVNNSIQMEYNSVSGVLAAAEYGYSRTEADILAFEALGVGVIIGDPITLTANLTLDVPLKILETGQIITDGFTCVINNSFEAGLYQCFDADVGEVQFGNGALSEVYSEWWGAVPDNSTDCTDPIRKAIGSIPSGGIVQFVAGNYRHTGILLPKSTSLRGINAKTSNLIYNDTVGDSITLTDGVGNIFYNSITKLGIRAVTTSSGAGIASPNDLIVTDVFIEDYEIEGFLEGIRLPYGLQVYIGFGRCLGQGKAVANGVGVRLGNRDLATPRLINVGNVEESYVNGYETSFISHGSVQNFTNIISENCIRAFEIQCRTGIIDSWVQADTTLIQTGGVSGWPVTLIGNYYLNGASVEIDDISSMCILAGPDNVGVFNASDMRNPGRFRMRFATSLARGFQFGASPTESVLYQNSGTLRAEKDGGRPFEVNRTSAGLGALTLYGLYLNGSAIGHIGTAPGGTNPALLISGGGSAALTWDDNQNTTVGGGAINTTATNGFAYIPTCSGTPTGVPSGKSGFVPLVVDTTNHKLYFYSGGAWRDAGP